MVHLLIFIYDLDNKICDVTHKHTLKHSRLFYNDKGCNLVQKRKRRRRGAIFIPSLEVESDQTSIACKCLSAKDELRLSIVNDLAFISTMKDVFEPNYIFHSDCVCHCSRCRHHVQHILILQTKKGDGLDDDE